MKIRLLILVLVMGVAFAGSWSCSRNEDTAQRQSMNQSQPASEQSNPPAATPPESEQPQQAPAESRPQQPAHTEARRARSEAPPAPAQPTVQMMEVPAGTVVQTKLNDQLSTDKNQVGNTFTATVSDNVMENGIVVVPSGSTISGEIARSQRAPRVGGKAEMTLQFNELTTPDGKTQKIFADPLALEGKSTTKGDVEKIVGGAVGGAVLGGILGGGKGAVKGGAAGGAAGGVWAVATRGQDIVLEPGREIAVTLARPVTVQAKVPAGPNP
jgi:cytoskeletal protein RodZ